LPIEKVKIDRTFISDVPGNAAAEKLLRALIALIKGLDLEVVAEGIETQAQLELIRAYDCDSAQGYYFGRPAPADKLAPTLQRDKEALAPIN
jgi:EAL domain-containing protein (putative c-di-GMP-specific phosphodiesterase class I)